MSFLLNLTVSNKVLELFVTDLIVLFYINDIKGIHEGEFLILFD